MKHLLTGGILALVFLGCSKSAKKGDNNQLPEHITGTVKSLDIDYIDLEPAIPRGYLVVNGSDDKTYNFKFAKIDGMYLNADNCAMSLDTTLVLGSDALFDTVGTFITFKNCYLPNTFVIHFFDSAQAVDTKGVKEVYATFTAETKITAGFLNYDHELAYDTNRSKSIEKINAIVQVIKDASPNPGNQPAKMLCQSDNY